MSCILDSTYKVKYIETKNFDQDKNILMAKYRMG